MMKEIIMLCAMYYGQAYNVSPELILAVAKTESMFKPRAIGIDGKDIGLMQVRHIYTKETKTELSDACLNIKIGTQILSKVRELCKFKDDYTYLICYNRGVSGGNKVHKPKQDKYYKTVMRNLGELNDFKPIKTRIEQTLYKEIGSFFGKESRNPSCCIYR